MEEEILKRISGAQRQTKIVEFPAGEFMKLVSNFVQMDDNFGRIDLFLVEEFLFNLYKNANIPTKRLKVYDDYSICILERIEENGRPRILHTPVDGLSERQKEILAYLIRKKTASVEELLDDVWRRPVGNRGTVYTTICNLDNFLEEKGYGFYISRNTEGKYQIFFKP